MSDQSPDPVATPSRLARIAADGRTLERRPAVGGDGQVRDASHTSPTGAVAVPESTIQRPVVGWSPPRELNAAAWLRFGVALRAAGVRQPWILGDWIRVGTARFQPTYIEVSGLTGYNVQTLRNVAHVARGFVVERRRAHVPWSAHALLVSLALADQEYWLTRAEADGLTLHQLRSLVRVTIPSGVQRPSSPTARCVLCGQQLAAPSQM